MHKKYKKMWYNEKDRDRKRFDNQMGNSLNEQIGGCNENKY